MILHIKCAPPTRTRTLLKVCSGVGCFNIGLWAKSKVLVLTLGPRKYWSGLMTLIQIALIPICFPQP